MLVNQNDEPIKEWTLFSAGDFKNDTEVANAVLLLANHLGMRFVRTNATKHGHQELELRKEFE